ncbi:MAG TPA: ATP-binding protein [Anaeromyxobacteraceae bacterium]|nr:ATP-binding protein [Anaeromyxobacteraceae bacterium]
MKRLRVLMVEDSEDDAILIDRELRRGGYATECRRVESAEGLRDALSEPWDVVISDYAMPRFSGTEALRLVREGGDLPFVLVSGTIGEENAVEALKNGAGDFVTKQNLSRLVPAVEREIADAQVRRERRKTLEALQLAVAARDQFLSIASHELKTPLTSLQLQIQSLQRTLETGLTEPDRIRQKVKRAARSAERLAELVNRLLDVSRITSGTIDLVRDEFDLSELTREVAGRFDEALRESGSRLDIFAAVPVRGRWDSMRIDTIITNLVSNAVKYGEGKPIEVRVEGDRERARLEVKDRGIGIASSDQVRIFERFERAVPERHYGGFGVGLWIARLVAEAHGGRIRVQSEKGVGSTFVLELPLGLPAAAGERGAWP